MEKERVLELLKKLKNLSDVSRATTAEEASNAAIRMAELMLKYRISEKDLEPENKEEVVQHLFQKTLRPADWKIRLLTAIADVNQCVAAIANDPTRGLYIYGRNGNIQATIYIFKFAEREMNKILRKEKKLLTGDPRKVLKSWRMGFCLRLGKLLREQMNRTIKSTVTGNEVVKHLISEVTDYLNKHYDIFIKWGIRFNRDENYLRGEKAAETINLSGLSTTKPRLQTNRNLLN